MGEPLTKERLQELIRDLVSLDSDVRQKAVAALTEIHEKGQAIKVPAKPFIQAGYECWRGNCPGCGLEINLSDRGRFVCHRCGMPFTYAE